MAVDTFVGTSVYPSVEDAESITNQDPHTKADMLDAMTLR
jgi:hypothetical protein